MRPTLATLAILKGSKASGGLLAADADAEAGAGDTWNLSFSWDTFSLDSHRGLTWGLAFGFSRAALSSSDFLRILMVLVKSERMMASPHLAGSSRVTG